VSNFAPSIAFSRGMTRGRFLVAAVAAFAVIAAPASADQPLIGTNGKGRMRVLDRDLRIVPGTPALPRSTDGTVVSPDDRRFASWSFYGHRLTIRNRRTFRAITTRRIDVGTDVYWPTRNHVIAVTYKPNDGTGKRPNVIRSFDLARGTSRTIRLRGLPEGVERVGRIVRVVTETGDDFCCATGRFTVTDISAAGVVKRRWRVPLPDEFVISDDSDQAIGMRLSRNLLLATQNAHNALIRIHRGTAKMLDLPSDYYNFVGRDFVFAGFGGHAARIDRHALTASEAVDTGLKEEIATPFDGGFIVGFGRARYDRSLQLVAENPTPPNVEGFSLVVAHDRIYDILFDCEGMSDAGVAIADAKTGAPIATRPGRWKFGVLGSGYLKSTGADDICD
jgi:hypothetical protein